MLYLLHKHDDFTIIYIIYIYKYIFKLTKLDVKTSGLQLTITLR